MKTWYGLGNSRATPNDRSRFVSQKDCMSSVFRRKGSESIESSTSWDLAEQLRDVTVWLAEPGNAELVRGSVLDVGFNSRLGDVIMVQGESIPASFMRQLVALDIDLWLSIYPPFDETPALDEEHRC